MPDRTFPARQPHLLKIVANQVKITLTKNFICWLFSPAYVKKFGILATDDEAFDAVKLNLQSTRQKLPCQFLYLPTNRLFLKALCA